MPSATKPSAARALASAGFGAFGPLLGFFFMPYTTLAYAWAQNSNGSVDGFYLVAVVVAATIAVAVSVPIVVAAVAPAFAAPISDHVGRARASRPQRRIDPVSAEPLAMFSPQG